MPLSGPDGKAAGFTLEWKPSNPGELLLGRVLPVMLLVGILASGALLFVAFMSIRLASHLKIRERNLLKAEIEGSRLRADMAEEISRS
jgi:hypothetical protein